MQLSDAKVTCVRETEHRRGVQWTMKISIGNRLICVAENAGIGGPNNYTDFDIKAWSELEALAEKALNCNHDPMEMLLSCCEIGDTLQDAVEPALFHYRRFLGGDR